MNICSELKKCCTSRSNRSYSESFTRSRGGKDSLRRTHSHTVGTVLSMSSPSNGRVPHVDSGSMRCVNGPADKGTHPDYFECSNMDQAAQTHPIVNTGQTKWTANGHIHRACGNFNQNNNENVFKEAAEKLNTNCDSDNVHLTCDSSLCDSETDCEEQSTPMIVLGTIEQVPPSECETSALSPLGVRPTIPMLPSVVKATRQAEMPPGDNQHTLLYPLLIECDSDESIEL